MIYIIGHRGQVGSLLKKQCPGAMCYESRLEIKEDVKSFLSKLGENDTVYLAASMTAVDECEKNPDISYKVNVLGPKYVADYVAAAKATLVFYSSDYVFDGRAGIYSINDCVNPINVYGRHKVYAEHYIQQHVKKYHILRTNLVFGPDDSGRNFSSRLIASLRAGQMFLVPEDEWVTPTYNRELVRGSLSIVEEARFGIEHVVGDDVCTRVHLANLIAERYKLDMTLIRPVRSDYFNRAAARPLDCGLKPTYSCATLVFAVEDMFSGGKYYGSKSSS